MRRTYLTRQVVLLIALVTLSLSPVTRASEDDPFGVPPDWNYLKTCKNVLKQILPAGSIATTIGLPDVQLLGLSRFAKAENSYVILLKPTLGSLRFQGIPHAIAKPMKIFLRNAPSGIPGGYQPFHFKSARRGPLEGVVVKPNADSFPPGPELENAQYIWDQNWPMYRDHDFTVDAKGIVRDPEKNFYFSDYDLLAVFDVTGKRRSFGRDGDQLPKVKGLLQPLNEAVGGEFFRHDGYYEKEYFDKMVASLQPTVVIGPDGNVWLRPARDVPQLVEYLRGHTVQR